MTAPTDDARTGASPAPRHPDDSPNAAVRFRRITNPDQGGDWGAHLPADTHAQSSTPAAPPDRPSLVEAGQSVERIGRRVDHLQMLLSGLAQRAFTHPNECSALLGLPEGKTGHRSVAHYLQATLGIELRTARTRTDRARLLASQPEALGQPAAGPVYPVLSTACAEAELTWASADHISSTLENVQAQAQQAAADQEMTSTVVAAGEALLTAEARTLDPDAMRRVCGRWAQYAAALLAPDGDEPSDGDMDHRRGLFYRGQRQGLHHWMITADDLEHEVLKTVAEAAANPRSRDTYASPDDLLTAAEQESDADPSCAQDHPQIPTDPRSRAQKQMNGLISALQGALRMTAGNGLPRTGGRHPQVMVHIDYEQLLGQVRRSQSASPPGVPPPGTQPPEPPGPAPRSGQAAGISEATFVGPIHPTHLRTLACDAELIPVVLGTEGEVLDLGATGRFFTPVLRRAIVARDGGCTAPGCTIPAPWCEAHHVQHWSRSGPTSVENGALLCSHHHHAVHAGAWEMSMRHGRPWFTPAPHLDPQQRPQRNRYWRP